MIATGLGTKPERIALQPGGRYAWVGLDGLPSVVAIDTETNSLAAGAEAGAGLHSLAFTEDGRFVYVSNSEANTVSAIDTEKLRRVAEITVSRTPGPLAFSSASGMLYVAAINGAAIDVIDPKRQEAVARVPSKRGVVALGFEPQLSGAANSFLASAEIPLIGPATLSPRLSLPPNRYVFYLLPTFKDQARVLVDYVRSKSGQREIKLAAISSQGEYGDDSLAGMKSQAELYGIEIALQEKYAAGSFDAAKAVAQIRAVRPTSVFFFGSGSDFVSLTREAARAGIDAPLLSSAVILGREVFGVPASAAPNVLLSYPAPLPNDQGFGEFMRLLSAAHVPLRNSAFQRSAYAAAKILVEAVKRSGRLLSRSRMVEVLDEMRDFETGVIPAVSFGPNRRVGAAGSIVMGLDLGNKRYVPLTAWMKPKDRP